MNWAIFSQTKNVKAVTSVTNGPQWVSCGERGGRKRRSKQSFPSPVLYCLRHFTDCCLPDRTLLVFTPDPFRIIIFAGVIVWWSSLSLLRLVVVVSFYFHWSIGFLSSEVTSGGVRVCVFAFYLCLSHIPILCIFLISPSFFGKAKERRNSPGTTPNLQSARQFWV